MEQRSARLVERDGDLAAVRLAVRAASAGEDALVLLRGEAGIGKSTVLAAARAEAAAGGVRVLAAGGAELDRDTPFAVVTDLLGPVLAAPGAGPALLTGQAALAGPLFDGSSPVPTDSDSLLRGLYWLVAGIAATGGGLLIAVDDAHWMDRSSLRFLLHLAGRLDGLPVAVVVAARPDAPGPVSELLDRLSCLPRAQVLRLRPLTPGGAAQVVADVFPDADAGFADACARVSGGNPFLLHELLLALRDGRVAPTATSVPAVERTVPDSVARAVLVRLAGLTDQARRLAAAVAVLGETPLPLAADLADLAVEEAEAAADLLSRGRVLAPGLPLRFAHPLLASAVHDDVPPFARGRAHRRAAELLAAAGVPHDCAAHLLLAPPAGEAETVRLLREAAAAALGRGAPEAAVVALRRALAEPPPDDELLDLLIELSTAEGRSGYRSARATVAQAVQRAAGTDDEVRALTATAAVCYAEGDVVGMGAATERALGLLEPTDPRAQTLLCQYLAAGRFHAPSRSRMEHQLAGLVTRARAGLEPEHPALLAQLALQVALTGGPPLQVRALAERAVATDALVEPSMHGLPLSLVIQALVAVDELTVAERLAGAGLAAARARGDETAHALAGFHRALPRYHRGDLAGALADLEPALRRIEEGRAGAVGFLSQQLVLLHLARDDPAAAEIAAQHGAGAAPDSLNHPMTEYGRAVLAMARGNAALAGELAARAGAGLERGFGIDHPGLVPWRCVAARAANAGGRRIEARRLAQDALERARWAGTPRPLAQALRAAAAVDDGPGALDLLREAAGITAGSAARLEHAAGLTDLGSATRRVGDPAGARKVLFEAFELAHGMGAHALTRRARKELFALGARPRRAATTGVDALTPAERRIAELAAAGLANRQIAEALFVSPKTVETHLAGVFRKLGVATRQEVAAHFPSDA